MPYVKPDPLSVDDAKRIYAGLPDEQKSAIEQMVSQGHKRRFAMESVLGQDYARGEQKAADLAEPKSLGEKLAAYQLAGAQTLGFGLSDEAAGAGAAIAAPFRGRGIVSEYERARDEQRGELAAAAERNPELTGLGEASATIGGMVGGGGGAVQAAKASALRPLQLLGRGAATGAGVGAAGGFGAGEGVEGTLKEMGKGAAFGGVFGLLGGALPALRVRRTAPKPAAAPSAAPGIGAGVERAAELYGKAGNLPIVGRLLPGAKAAGGIVDALKLVRKAQAPEAPAVAPAAPVPEAPAGPVQMPPLPREARAAPLPEPTAVKVTPDMVVDKAPSEALRIRKIGEANNWQKMLEAGNGPETIARVQKVPVEDVQAFAKLQRTNPEAGPTAADAPLPAPEPEPPAPSPFARAQPAQPEPTAQNVPPGISPERWQQLVAHYGKQPDAPSVPGGRPSAPAEAGTVVGRTPKPPPDPVTNTAIPVTQSQIQASMTPEAFDIQKSALSKFDAVRRARQALEGTAEVVGEQAPKWVDDVKAELRAKGANPAEIERVTDRMLTEGWDPHLVMQAIGKRRSEELGAMAGISRLTGKTMKENLVAQAIASGAKDADEIAKLTGLNLAEVELLAGRHNVLVPRGVPDVKPTKQTPINPAPLDESGDRVFAPAYKEIFKEPMRLSGEGSKDFLSKLPPGVGDDEVRKILEARARGIVSERGQRVEIQPQQIAQQLGIHPDVVRFILKERASELPRLSLLRNAPEAPAFDEGAKVMARGREPGNVARVKMLLNDKAGLAKLLDDMRAAGWTEDQISDTVSKAKAEPKPLKVRKRTQ